MSLAHPAGELRRATKPRLVAGHAALHRRAHDAQRVDFVPAGDRDARVGVGGPAAGAHVHGDHRTAGAAPRRRKTARLHRVARGKARVALRRVYAPEHNHIGSLTDLAQRGPGPAAPLGREHTGGGRGGDTVEHRAEPIAQRHGLAQRFARQVRGEIDERPPRGPQGPRGLPERLLERRRAAVHAHVLWDPSVTEPRGAQRARVARFGDAILLHDDGDVVASAPAAEAGDVLHGPRGGAHAIRRSRASISRYSERARRTSAA